jgi:aminomethyltransferase
MKATPLNAMHRSLHAKLADFAGWEMPISYGSELEEHRAVRSDAGMFDVSHMLAVDVAGRDARDNLSRLLANDVAKLNTPGKALYSCLLNDAGGILDDLMAYWLGDDRFRLIVNAGTREKDLSWLRERAHGALTIEPRFDRAIIAVQGPRAIEKFGRACPSVDLTGLQRFCARKGGGWLVSRTGYTGEDGVEIVLPNEEALSTWQALLDAGVRPAGLAARDLLRLEAGMLLYGQDMDEMATPIECGLAWTVDLKRDFIGAEALRERAPAFRLAGLFLEDRGVLRHGQRVVTSGGEGTITSGGYSPTLSRAIALARVPAAISDGARVEVAVRDKILSARVVSPPFVRAGRALIH